MKNAASAAIVGLLICVIAILVSERVMPFDFWVLMGGIGTAVLAGLGVVALKRRDHSRTNADVGDGGGGGYGVGGSGDCGGGGGGCGGD